MITYILRLIFIGILFLIVGICVKVIDMLIDLENRWRLELKDRFLDWYWAMRKKFALRRISVNHHKMKRLSDVEGEPTPEMLAIAERIEKDVQFVSSYNTPEPAPEDLAKAITEDDISISTLILNKIDEMIILETENILVPLASVNHNIDVRNYGDHVKSVAESVQKGLNLEIYKTNTIFTPEYINSYIVKKSSVMVLTTMMNLNKQLPPPE